LGNWRGIALNNLLKALSEYSTLNNGSLGLSNPAMPNQISFRYFKASPEIIQLAVMLYSDKALKSITIEQAEAKNQFPSLKTSVF